MITGKQETGKRLKSSENNFFIFLLLPAISSRYAYFACGISRNNHSPSHIVRPLPEDAHIEKRIWRFPKAPPSQMEIEMLSQFFRPDVFVEFGASRKNEIRIKKFHNSEIIKTFYSFNNFHSWWYIKIFASGIRMLSNRYGFFLLAFVEGKFEFLLILSENQTNVEQKKYAGFGSFHFLYILWQNKFSKLLLPYKQTFEIDIKIFVSFFFLISSMWLPSDWIIGKNMQSYIRAMSLQRWCYRIDV